MAKFVRKTLTDPKDISFILDLANHPDYLTRSFFQENFSAADFDETPRFTFNDEITIPKGTCGNTKDVVSTIGRFFFNIFLFRTPIFREAVGGYDNERWDKKHIGKVMQSITDLFSEDKIPVEQYKKFMQRAEFLCMVNVSMATPAFDERGTTIPPETKKLKEHLLSKYHTELENNDADVAEMIEQQLIASAKKELEGDTIMWYWDCESRGSFKNNFKTQALLVGVRQDPSGDLNVVKTSLEEGITEKSDYVASANSATVGTAGRALETGRGGYLIKVLAAMAQTIQLDDDGTDCGTPLRLEVDLTSKAVAEWMKWMYFSEKPNDKELTLLTPENMRKYLGKTLHFRSPMFCRTEKICSLCMGSISQTGLGKRTPMAALSVGSAIQGASMKKFHDLTIKWGAIDLLDSIT